ncbi:melanopsin-like [Mizuhopecten yessoensis]|uniref:melanopsin-like n=1 Tax=Mizuhopecten yessoensis TaxID=6573 RepID=UPI000B4574DA|nr:melanopsin-like [Mizuhopecten yessoensis]
MEVYNETSPDLMLGMDSNDINVSDYVYMLMALSMFAIFMMGLLFNALFIYILLFHNKLRTRNNVYIITLCVASILISVLAVPFVGVSAVSHHWLFGTNGCLFHGFIVTWLGLIQICILSVISVEKYLIIVRRNREDFLSSKATLTLVRRRRKIRFASCKDGTQTKAKEVKVIKTIFLLIAAFIVSWLPYSGLVFITMFYPYKSIHPVLATVPALFAKSSIIWNPVIYLMTNTTFKRAVVKLIPCAGVLILINSTPIFGAVTVIADVGNADSSEDD